MTETIDLPRRELRDSRRQAMAKLCGTSSRDDTPSHLALDAIKRETSLFQPRFDSIAYAPGRSDAHITHLAKVAKAGGELDPVKVTAFGNEWYLLDGHHRLEAYRAAEWTRPVPVEVRHSELVGDERVAWAIQESVEENKKNHLAMSEADKLDAAWWAVARNDELSISATAKLYGVSDRSVANMRKARSILTEAGVPLDRHPVLSWSSAREEAKRIGADEKPSRDWDAAAHEERVKRRAAKKLRGVMDMGLPARMLAEVLEAYEPGIVESMSRAQKIAKGDYPEDWGLDDDLI